MIQGKTPAQTMSFCSLEMVKAHNREGWLDLFADNAVVEDPIGVSPFDPAGLGHRGKATIGAFYDNIVSGAGNMEYTIHASCPCGNECANVWTSRFTDAGGAVSETSMVTIYKVNATGDKPVSLRAFWDTSRFDPK